MTAAPLKIAFIVTEYPKTTETFVLRDIMEFHRAGCDLRIFSLTHFNKKDVLHDFAQPTRAWARDYAYLLSPDVLGAFSRAIMTRPATVAGLLRDMVRGAWRDPAMLMKSLFILPKSLRIASELEKWGGDHVHAAYAGHPATAAWIVRRVAGIPFSASSHAHDLFETQALLDTKLPEAEFVRTISEYNRGFLERHVPHLDPAKIDVIHVGTWLDGLPKREPAHGFEILYVGSLEYRKGVDLLLRAFADRRQPGWRLRIIGHGPEHKVLVSLAETLGISRDAAFEGAQPNEVVTEAMRRASVLAVPSRIGPRNQTEGLPTVIVEALSHELPVVATRLTGIPEIVQHGQTGLLFEMNNVDQLGDALGRTAADPADAAAMAAQGRELVEKEFDQRLNARRLLDRIRRTLPVLPS